MKYSLVVIGASLGGLRALTAILAVLPKSFPLPVAIVQHRNPDASDSLQFVLQDACALPVREAPDMPDAAVGVIKGAAELDLEDIGLFLVQLSAQEDV